MPGFVPKLQAWGKFKHSPPDTYFFLMEFIDLGSETVEPPDFCRLIAQLHQMSISPTGKFGFFQTTYQGPSPQNTTWESNWCTYFTRLLTQFFDREISQNGPQPEYEAAYRELVSHVVPKLLEPLQSDGRVLKPCLIHGDLWEANTGLNLDTELPVVFDASAMYAHNEMELGMWRADIIRFGTPHYRQYLSHMPPSEPAEKFDDRNRLYSIKFNIAHCLGWPDSAESHRQLGDCGIHMSNKGIPLSGLQSAESSATASENDQIADNDNSPAIHGPYSVFTSSQKLSIVLLVAFASCFSPLSSFIYYPGLTAIAKDLHTTLSKINLTITSYMIVSGVAPTIFGSMADQVGRRPVYLLMFLLYVLANVGLALQSSYPALLLLRMLQSAGGSATIGLGYGVVGDITESSERGAYMGILGCGPNVAPGLGPVLGGVLIEKAGWRWTFGFLAISGALSLVLIGVLLPETGRNIVGNGSLPVPNLNKSIVLLWREKREKKATLLPQGYRTDASESVARITTMRIPNPLGSVHIFLQRESAPVILINGVFYSAYCCLQASLSSLFISIYGYRELEAGLIYIPFGVGAETSESQRLAFAIFHARLRSMTYLLPLSIFPLLAYGWVLEYHLHPSIPLILQFFIGGAMTIIFNACGTLLVDLHPSRPSTAQAALNLLRCAFAAGELAALQPLINAIGLGWCYTVIALMTGGIAGVCVVIGSVWGEKWRRQRHDAPDITDGTR
ncbi:hypothetical protein LTR20_006414 [Exophiala xenobiotica]|nr:hypothetical protein LTR93_005844 [Exophiala xenobiotica]KAK5412856.1 hypothetical protein LTR90_006978 [Exophiala xenobiotica]KAK5461490.1 hypothetical protein LTR20_006414 [Exophiala xenobiotica]KAK5482174.1 hypothetical protein LTR26_006508 [Exophiala xenobiotica]KAK5506881.1 hypothetical protein LTR21_009092 [Exophiala xenobiotica]